MTTWNGLGELGHDVRSLRGHWGWFVLLGVALVVLGFIALWAVVAASLATALAIGIMLVIAGVGEIIGAFWCRAWSGVFLHLLSGVLSAVVGALFLASPVGALLALTLLLACLLIVGGVFKIVVSLSYRFAAWGAPLLSGIIDLILGLLIWSEWPGAGLWVIGMFVGITLIFRGFNWIALGTALHRPTEGPRGMAPAF